MRGANPRPTIKGEFEMYNKMEAFFVEHKVIANMILGLEGAAIGIMFALAI